MSKISIEETNIESLNSEFEYDYSENQLRKKIGKPKNTWENQRDK